MQLAAKFISRNHSRYMRTLLAELALVSLFLIVWMGMTINLRPLSIPDEGRYVGVAWEMVQSDKWLTPTLDGLPYFHKPPLFYWITATWLKVFGATQWAARIAPLTGALIAALSIYNLMRRWVSIEVARLSLLILATSPFFYGGAQYANHDMLVAGFITATIAFSGDAILSIRNGKPYRHALLLAWMCAALGLLSKGLIGIALPGGVIFCWLLIEKNGRLLQKLCWWPGPVLFTSIALPWFAMVSIQHPGFLYYFFIEQQFQRFVGTGFNNTQPFWFLPAVLIVLNLPWIIFLYTRIKLPREHNTNRASLRHLLWLWLLFILIFFSIPKSKLIGYILPVLPALAALIAEGLDFHPVWGRKRNLRRPCMTLLAGLLCVMSIAGIAIHERKSSRHLADLYGQKASAEAALVFFNVYPFDMGFYARLRLPVIVIDEWDRAAFLAEDSWHKELIEAGKFAPKNSQHTLLPYSALPVLLCKNPVTWIVALLNEARINAALQNAEIIGKNEQYVLLRLSRSDRHCPENFTENF